MASDPADTPPAAEELPRAPLAGTRSQSMQRLQVGLVGLATMILLVALANVINANRKQNEALVVPEAAPTVAAQADKPVSDPLADAGVLPAPAVEAEPSASPPPPNTGDAPRVQP